MSTLLFIIQTIILLGGDPSNEACQVYPKDAIVTEIDLENDTFTVTDFGGDDWVIEGVEDWEKGDKIGLIMYNNMTTETIYDDIVLTVRYEGWVY